MHTDLASDLSTLLQARARALIGEDAFQHGLRELRERYGGGAVELALADSAQDDLPGDQPSARADQTITGNAQVTLAIAGDVTGHVTIQTQNPEEAAELVRRYLEVVVRHCRAIPLPTVREPMQPSRNFQINLDQVYLHAATTALVEREVFDRPVLRTMDLQGFIQARLSQDCLPTDFRPAVALRRRRRKGQPAEPLPPSESAVLRKQDERLELQPMLPHDREDLARDAERLGFYGPQLISEAVASNPRLVVLGAPGSGKSTVLRYFALSLAETYLQPQIELAQRLHGWAALAQPAHLPILVPLLPLGRYLSEFPDARGDAEDLWNYLVTQIDPDGGHIELHNAVLDQLRAGKTLMMLDGLDEIVGTDVRRKVVQAVLAFSEVYPACRIALTCRVRPYENAAQEGWALPLWPSVTLADWTLGQMKEFTTLAYTAVAARAGLAPQERDERIQAVHAALVSRPDLQRLGTRPLLLAIMVLVHLNDHDLPEDRGTLYDRCIDLLLGQWEKQRGGDFGTLAEFLGLPTMDISPLRSILCDVALHAHTASTSDRQGGLGRSTLFEMIGNSLEAAHHPKVWEGAKQFLEYIDMRSGLLQPNNNGETYVFAHQALQEYLAGLALVRDPDAADSLMALRNADHWRMPIILGVIHLISQRNSNRVYVLFQKLLVNDDRTAEQAQRDAIFAAEIGEEVGWDRLIEEEPLFTYVRHDLAKALVEVLEGHTLSAILRVRVGTLLGRLGDPRSGVTTLPPSTVACGEVQLTIGSTAAEAQVIGKEYARYYRARGETTTARRAQAWPLNEMNEQSLTLAAFGIGRYLVTNAQFALFIAADGYNAEQPWWDAPGRDWLLRDDNTITGLDPWQRRICKNAPEFWLHPIFGAEHPNRPVVGMSWYEAMAFCRWLTAQQAQQHPDQIVTLPSEAEWEYAARGASRRPYPWGDTEPDDGCANFGDCYKGTVAVGCFGSGATPEGIYDLAGNVWEWTRSQFQPYPYNPHDGRESNEEPQRCKFVARGGGWHSRAIRLRAATRNLNAPDNHFNDLGFRISLVKRSS